MLKEYYKSVQEVVGPLMIDDWRVEGVNMKSLHENSSSNRRKKAWTCSWNRWKMVNNPIFEGSAGINLKDTTIRFWKHLN